MAIHPIMETILSHCLDIEKTHTYVGIGSCPHVSKIEDLTPRWDQLLPLFLDPILKSKSDTSLLVVHFDPAFARTKELLDAYFSSAYITNRFGPFLHYSESNLFVWLNNRVHVLIVPCSFYTGAHQHTENHRWFLESLVQDAIESNTKLIVQDYTGYELEPVFRFLYQNSHPPGAFRQRILFDVSYGCDTGCTTDLTKYAPLYDIHGNFINLLLLTPREVLYALTICSEKDRLLPYVQRLYFRMFRECLNTIHPDYRRRRAGDSTFSTAYRYGKDSSPETIMKVLQEEIYALIPVLREVNLFSLESQRILDHLFQSYSTMDPYKWYGEVYNLVDLPPEKIETSIT